MTKQERKVSKRYQRRRLHEILVILHKNGVTHGLTPDKLVNVISDLGPTYIKLGQILSMRQDLIPKEYCEELLTLQTNVNPLPFSEVIEVLEQEYGQSVDMVFSHIDPTPLGSASIAQVHRAVLRDSGEEVVIKVQRPGIYETMHQDVKILKRAVRILKVVGPKNAVDVIDLEAVLQEMWEAAKQEMNFMIEANNAEQFAKLNNDVSYFESPKIFGSHSTDKVLVMSYIPGIDIDQRETLEKAGYDLGEISQKLCVNYIKQVITDGFFHADPHPGNIRIHGGKIAWLDLGMMGRLSAKDRRILNKALSAIAYNDTESLKSAFLMLGEHKGPVDNAKLYEQIDDMLEEYRTMDINEIDVGRFLGQVLDICTENHITMPSDITMLYRGIATIESVVTQTSPESSIVEIMLGYVRSQSGSAAKGFDLKDEMVHLFRKGVAFTDSTLQIPVSVTEFLNMALKGHTKVNVAVTGSEEPLAALAKMVNRLVIGIIMAALLVGSSFLAGSNVGPKFFGISTLGVFGFVISFCLGVWIVVQMLIQDRKLDKHK